MTERLYYADSYLTNFAARVVRAEAATDGRTTVVLDRTAFYPTGGGQPADAGALGAAQVVGCETDSSGDVLHIVEGAPPAPGSRIEGRINLERRRDHIEQHTAQHILSRAFLDLFDAPTAGFRMDERGAEIDVALADPTDERIFRALDLANRVVRENRSVRIRYMDADEAARRGVRRRFEREGTLRVIEIEDFDLNPCGGTHARATGEVGGIGVTSWERAKGMTRLAFVAGSRLVADHRRTTRLLRDAALLLSVGASELPAAVARLLDDDRARARRLSHLEEQLAHHEAAALVRDAAPRPDGVRIVRRRFDDRSAERLKRLASEIARHERTIALLASTDAGAVRLVFARSAEAPGDMNGLMRLACSALGGRGGGRHDFAQGGGTDLANLDQALDAAEQELT